VAFKDGTTKRGGGPGDQFKEKGKAGKRLRGEVAKEGSGTGQRGLLRK